MKVQDTVLPGELLGPVVGLAFSKDGGLLFACAGSSVRVFEVASGRALLSRRVLEPGVSLSGIDVVDHQGSVGAVFGDRYVRVVDGVPTAKDMPRNLCSLRDASSLGKACFLSSTDGQHSGGRDDTANLKVATWSAMEGNATRSDLIPRSSWFRTVARLPELADRVWDARLIGGADCSGGNGGRWRREQRDREKKAGDKDQPTGLVAVALAHNFVEVWNWTVQGRPEQLWRSCKGDVCLLYHARLWGRTLAELRVASGTVYNQVLVWKPSDERAGERGRETQGEVPGSVGLEKVTSEGNQHEGDGEKGERGRHEVLRLKGHEGVIFRVAWRQDGKRVASVSDDRTVRVWDVESVHDPSDPVSADRDGEVVGVHGSNASRGWPCNLRDGEFDESEEPWKLLWTGWGHSSRVWDVAFCGRGLVSAGEDGTAILWNEDRFPRDRARSNVEGFMTVGAQAGANASPSVDDFSRHRMGERDGGQRTPGAIMRGHSGSPVWRLAVYESNPHAGVGRYRGGSGLASVVEDDVQGLELLATGGNDGAIKLWDLAFESACRKGQSIGRDTFWGETDTFSGSNPRGVLDTAKPCDVTTTSSAVKPSSQCSGYGDLERITGMGPLHPAPSSSRNILWSSWRSSDFQKWHRPEDPEERAPGCETALSGRIASVSGSAQVGVARVGQSIGGRRREGDEGRRSGKEEKRGQGRKRQRSTLVREVRLSHDGTGAAVLFADGRVMWVENLASGCWEQVTVEAENGDGDDSGDGGGDGDDDARSESGVGRVRKSLMLPSDGISAIAVIRSTAVGIPGKGGDTESAFGNARDSRVHLGEVDSRYVCRHRRVCRDVIVAGRDDGVLFLTARARGYPDPSEVCQAPDDTGGEMPKSWHRGGYAEPRAAWLVETSWSGHRAKVTAVWPAGVGAVGECLPSGAVHCPLRAALDTSRLKAMPGREPGSIRPGAGALVSAAADGTLVWWKWTNEDGAGRCVPQMRMVCFAGTNAAIRSFVIDEEILIGSKRSGLGVQPPDAVLFCGDTKGNICCFAEFPDDGVDPALRHSKLSPEEKTGGGAISRAGVRVPTLEMKHQHGKDQVSRLALLGDCLLSAGHDGFVNHYLITYRRFSGVRKPYSFSRHEPKSTSTGDAPESNRSARPRGRKPVPPAVGVTLTLITCYPASPVTAIAHMWVGGGWWRGVEDVQDSSLTLDEHDKIRIVVAGRSGSARMSAWDLMEGRQLLELECGDKHLAQDLFLSWASTREGPFSPSARSIPCLEEAECSSVHRSVLGAESRGGSESAGESCNRPRAVATTQSLSGVARGAAECFLDRDLMLSSSSSPGVSSSWASIRPTFARLPRHTALFATSGSTGPDVTLTSGSRRDETKEHAHRALESRGDPTGAIGSYGSERHEKAPPVLAGVRLAFNSSIFGGGMSAEPEQCRRDTAFGVPDGEARGCTKVREDCKVPDCQDRRPGAGARTTSHGSGAQSWHAGAAAQGDSTFPQFSYSLSEPFHGQRVATVRFLREEMNEASAVGGEYGRRADARLITGGEDGMVKLLDVFCDEHDGRSAGRSESAGSVGDDQDDGVSGVSTSVSRTEGARASSGDESLSADDIDDVEGGEARVFSPQKGVSPLFCLPRLKVEQTLPPHESSIVSLAVASPSMWPSPRERGATDDSSGRADSSEQRLVFSGGGKMELRAWSLKGYRAKPPRGAEAAAPSVRWLLTTTPAPKSACHAHRIMCLCTLPVPPRQSLCRPIGHVDSGEDDGGGGDTVLVAAGDSGGGLSLFAVQNYGRRDGDDDECRSSLIGRWVSASARPVLCVAHAGVEVESSASPTSSASETGGLEAQSSGEGASCSQPTTPANAKQAAGTGADDRGSGCRMAGVRENDGRVERGSLDCDLVPDITETSEAVVPSEGDIARQESFAPVVLGKGTRPRPGSSCDGKGCIGHRDLQTTQGYLRRSKARETFDAPVGSGRHQGETNLGPTVQDVIITGDTAGKVTLWRVVRDDVVASQDHVSGSPGARKKRGQDETESNGSGAGMSWPFINRGPEGRRRGTAHAGPGQATKVPRLGLTPVLEYTAHQMGVLSVAVTSSHRKGRVLIATGGDDQAICVAEIKISIGNDGATSASLVGGAPDLIKGVAGSAVKSIALLVSSQCATSPVGIGDVSGATRVVGRSVSGVTSYGSHSMLSGMSLFSVSRDRRLSRWDLRRTSARAPSPSPLSRYLDREASSRDVPMREEGQPGSYRCEGREWELEWRAGCLTEVCDVSDMDVIALASDLVVDMNFTADDDDNDDDDRVGSGESDVGSPQGNEGLPPSAVTCLASPRVLVAVSGQGLQVFEFVQGNPA